MSLIEQAVASLIQSERQIQERLEDGTREMEAMREELTELRKTMQETIEVQRDMLKAQTEMLQQNKELMEVYKGFKATARVFGMIEKFALFITKVGAAAAVTWASWKFIISRTLEDLGK